MIVLLRVISLILVVSALMLLGADAVTSLERGGAITVRSVDQIWALFDKDSVDAFKSWCQVSLPGPLPYWVFSALALPGWGVTGVLGVILAFLFGRKLGPE